MYLGEMGFGRSETGSNRNGPCFTWSFKTALPNTNYSMEQFLIYLCMEKVFLNGGVGVGCWAEVQN